MKAPSEKSLHRLRSAEAADPLRWLDTLAVAIGTTTAIVHAGFVSVSNTPEIATNGLVILAMFVVTVVRLKRFLQTSSSTKLRSRVRDSRLLVPLIWLIGVFSFGIGGLVVGQKAFSISYVGWTDAAAALLGFLAVFHGCRRLAVSTNNSAVLLVGSFLVVILVGTCLLKLPACRPVDANGQPQSAEWNVALFTATSASCVTGLIVEPTGSYWSPLGHAVIFSLFQIGGFGILTFGAFVAVLSGRKGLRFREAGTLRDMLDSDTVQNSRRLLLTILIFTLVIESAGAACLLDLQPDQPLGQRLWNAIFLSVSAFCNAGFCLQDAGLDGQGTRWQIFGPVSLLIILGGLGFPVVNDLYQRVKTLLRPKQKGKVFGARFARHRLNLHSKLVLATSGILLLGGMVGWYALESMAAPPEMSTGKLVADAWFQSVTFRTAGFNSVDHGAMQPATKLLAIFLMFIGAAPGSTGGGIKTIVIAVTALNLWAVIRGRDDVQIFGRKIPPSQVARSLAMIAVGVLIVMLTTGLLTIFEQKPEQFLDHLFEATSAFGTVGVSTGLTGELSTPSRLLICVIMFLGRVGPITLLLAMAAGRDSTKVDYPEERVSLG